MSWVECDTGVLLGEVVGVIFFTANLNMLLLNVKKSHII